MVRTSIPVSTFKILLLSAFFGFKIVPANIHFGKILKLNGFFLVVQLLFSAVLAVLVASSLSICF
jgi:hypothetical protein